ncbi:uncharacterized protein V6R79_016131 [Siganus canaliculatus]
MATSSERSPPPFPDSEDQDVLDTEEVALRDSDEDDAEDLFVSTIESPLTEMDQMLPAASKTSGDAMTALHDIMDDPLMEPLCSQTESKPATEVVSEPSDDFVDLTNNIASSPDDSAAAETAIEDTAKEVTDIPLDEPTDGSVDISGSETESQGEEVVIANVTVEETAAVTVVAAAAVAAGKSEVASGAADPPGDGKIGSDAEQEAEETSTTPIIDLSVDLSLSDTATQPLSTEKIVDPLVDLLSDAPPAVKTENPSQATLDLFADEGSDLFSEQPLTKSAKPPQKSLFGEPDEDLFGEPMAVTSKKTVSKVPEKAATTKAAVGTCSTGGPLLDPAPAEPADIFTEEAVCTAPSISSTSSALNSKSNGLHSEEETDIFAEATVELSLDSPRDVRKKDVTAKPSAPAASLSAAAGPAKPQPAALEELEEEEEEDDDKFDIFVSVKDPEKIGDGMNAYMAYKVTTETTLPMFRNKTFTVRRRFSDFLGLFEKLSEKHGPNGCIVPPPPEKSILGMTKVKVGKEDSSSADFVERRRGALERYLQRVVTHPSLLQDPDVREFLEREELPRAVSTQALSGAGFLKMINKATDAVSKMTIKMNESDAWFEEKLHEVESADQLLRMLLMRGESLVTHRKDLASNTASFAKSVAMLGSAEDSTALSRALSQLAEVQDKMEQLHQDQAANDTFSFTELIADYIRLLGAVRGSFDQRMKAWQRWQDAQTMLQKKREAEAKLLWANKPDKLQLAKEEITEWEAKVTQYERDFERVTATVRKEVTRFEKEKARNFKRQIIKYLESMLQSQQQLIKYWEAFLPEAKAIA